MLLLYDCIIIIVTVITVAVVTFMSILHHNDNIDRANWL